MHFDSATIRQACTDLIVRYAYLNDERRYDELAALFTEDAHLYRPSAPELAIVGRGAIRAAFGKRPFDTITFHVTSDILVEAESAQRARASSRILLLSATRADDAAAAPPAAAAPLPGVFRDSFALTDDGWRFAERRGRFWI